MEFKCPIIGCEQRFEIGTNDKIRDVVAKVHKHIQKAHSIEEILQTPPFKDDPIMQKHSDGLKQLNGFIIVHIPIDVDFDIRR
jgi:predicted small metal-binding protein